MGDKLALDRMDGEVPNGYTRMYFEFPYTLSKQVQRLHIITTLMEQVEEPEEARALISYLQNYYGERK